MLFNSLHFVFFFIIVTTTYFLLPFRSRWAMLLLASCYFYMAFVPIYILILGFTIAIDYLAGIYIETSNGQRRKLFLILSLFANIGVLAFFKYYNFINQNLSSLLRQVFGYSNPIPFLSILLPIGLSFHTFQAMSYTIEVYRSRQKAERHFGIYSLYVMYYPQLVAGPIERPQNLLHQFREKHNFEYDLVVQGLKLMLWGFFKKLVIADRLAIYVDIVYNNPEQHNGVTLAMATLFFAFQIYCDFSGYSDIAIGASKVMGLKLMTNFNRPYFATSISEFWKRWHISLSTWFRDYLYISLGGKKVPIPRWYFNLFLVFLISGLWHGANWTYIIWGGMNGFYLVFAVATRRFSDKVNRRIWSERFPLLRDIFDVSTTFVLICFSWIFFRAKNVEDAFTIIQRISKFHGPIFMESPSMLSYSFFGIFMLLFIEAKKEYHAGGFILLNNENWIVRYLSYATLVILILLIGVLDGGQFIYFQF